MGCNQVDVGLFLVLLYLYKNKRAGGGPPTRSK